MQFEDLIKSRYSVRKFDSRPVPDDLINKVLEIARLAPTAVNKQPWHILVAQCQDAMAKLAKCTKYTFGAPCAIIVGHCPEKAWVRPFDNENSGIIDASIVATYVMLAIHDLGLGTCWVGYFDPRAVVDNMGINFTPDAIFPFGYPAADAAPSSKHAERLPLEQTTTWAGHF